MECYIAVRLYLILIYSAILTWPEQESSSYERRRIVSAPAAPCPAVIALEEHPLMLEEIDGALPHRRTARQSLTDIHHAVESRMESSSTLDRIAHVERLACRFACVKVEEVRASAE